MSCKMTVHVSLSYPWMTDQDVLYYSTILWNYTKPDMGDRSGWYRISCSTILL